MTDATAARNWWEGALRPCTCREQGAYPESDACHAFPHGTRAGARSRCAGRARCAQSSRGVAVKSVRPPTRQAVTARRARSRRTNARAVRFEPRRHVRECSDRRRRLPCDDRYGGAERARALPRDAARECGDPRASAHGASSVVALSPRHASTRREGEVSCPQPRPEARTLGWPRSPLTKQGVARDRARVRCAPARREPAVSCSRLRRGAGPSS
jgi:hypothetical protein